MIKLLALVQNSNLALAMRQENPDRLSNALRPLTKEETQKQIKILTEDQFTHKITVKDGKLSIERDGLKCDI